LSSPTAPQQVMIVVDVTASVKPRLSPPVGILSLQTASNLLITCFVLETNGSLIASKSDRSLLVAGHAARIK
jgi:hypothetical protein